MVVTHFGHPIARERHSETILAAVTATKLGRLRPFISPAAFCDRMAVAQEYKPTTFLRLRVFVFLLLQEEKPSVRCVNGLEE